MKRKSLIVLFIFLCIGAVFYLFRDSVVVKPIENEVQKIFSGARGFIFSMGVSKEENVVEENRRLREQKADVENIQRENEALRSQFEEKSTVEMKLLPVAIVGFKGRGAGRNFVINAGRSKGVRDGMAVILGKTLVGKVEKASEGLSEVMTVVNPKFSTLVKYPKTEARGILRGYGDFLVMEQVVITDTLEKDGIITTVGELNNENTGIPSDLVIGRIDSIDREESDTFQSAQIDPSADYSKLSTVFVVLGI